MNVGKAIKWFVTLLRLEHSRMPDDANVGKRLYDCIIENINKK